jgi:hypothetical protein
MREVDYSEISAVATLVGAPSWVYPLRLVAIGTNCSDGNTGGTVHEVEASDLPIDEALQRRAPDGTRFGISYSASL